MQSRLGHNEVFLLLQKLDDCTLYNSLLYKAIMFIFAKHNLYNTDNIIIKLIILKWCLLTVIVEGNLLLILKLLPLNIIINNTLSSLW